MIRVLPLDELGESAQMVAAPSSSDPLEWASNRRFTPYGRVAIDEVLKSLELSPDDEVLITNTSEQTYISPCVTCIVFNHAKPSRILTERTRAIIVIHEYGFPHPRLRELVGAAAERGIPLIEDCAHSFDSKLDGAPLGSFGDFAVFSLPKVLPVARGGILVANKHPIDGRSDREAEAAYGDHLPVMSEYARRRRRNYGAVRDRFREIPLLLEAGPEVTPFFIGLLRDDALEVKQRSSAIEWGSTLRDDLLLVTTNPLVEPEALVGALEAALEPARA